MTASPIYSTAGTGAKDIGEHGFLSALGAVPLQPGMAVLAASKVSLCLAWATAGAFVVGWGLPGQKANWLAGKEAALPPSGIALLSLWGCYGRVAIVSH
jgi:hypothetical protein